MVAQAISITPTLTGGTPAYIWTVTGLPGGLSVDPSSGIISGTPTTAGAASVKLTSTDSENVATSQTFTINVAAALSITDPPDQTGTVNTALTALQFAATGGYPAYTWAASGLPTGTSMSSAGKVTGTPTASGTFSATITATDVNGYTATDTVKWTIAPQPLVATDPADQVGDAGTALVALQMTATGGTGTYTWSASGLPSGSVSINSSTGKITGTPSTAGTYNATITVKDSAGATSSVTVKWTIAAAPNITSPSSNQTTSVNTTITTITGAVTGGTGSYTWSVTGLPTGLSFNTSTGSISGKPTAKGTYTVTVKAVDSLGASDTNTFTWKVQ